MSLFLHDAKVPCRIINIDRGRRMWEGTQFYIMSRKTSLEGNIWVDIWLKWGREALDIWEKSILDRKKDR